MIYSYLTNVFVHIKDSFLLIHIKYDIISYETFYLFPFSESCSKKMEEHFVLLRSKFMKDGWETELIRGTQCTVVLPPIIKQDNQQEVEWSEQ